MEVCTLLVPLCLDIIKLLYIFLLLGYKSILAYFPKYLIAHVTRSHEEKVIHVQKMESNSHEHHTYRATYWVKKSRNSEVSAMQRK